jgi:hypothetical protein
MQFLHSRTLNTFKQLRVIFQIFTSGVNVIEHCISVNSVEIMHCCLYEIMLSLLKFLYMSLKYIYHLCKWLKEVEALCYNPEGCKFDFR